ncbi:hypothetical protein [Bartonella apis]|uniref:hypothetical protein n=1 Tax=Bartonella apis TaxID=1686310 RepID=UPI003BB6A97C
MTANNFTLAKGFVCSLWRAFSAASFENEIGHNLKGSKLEMVKTWRGVTWEGRNLKGAKLQPRKI